MKYMHLIIILVAISMFTSCKEDKPSNSQVIDGGKSQQAPQEKNETKTVESEKNVVPPQKKTDDIVLTTETGNKKYKFRLKMTLNETRRHEIFSVFRISENIGGTEKASVFNSKIIFDETLIERNKDTSIIEWRYESFDKRSEFRDGRVLTVNTKDFTKSNSPLETLVFTAILNIPIKVHIFDNARIKKVEGSEALLNAALDNVFEEDYEKNSKTEEIENTLASSFNEKDLEQVFHEGYFRLPEKHIQVDESWQDEIVIGMQNVGDVAFKITLTLAAIKKVNDELIAEIKLSGEHDAENNDNEILGRFGIKDSSYEGKIEFNLTKGCFGNFTSKATIDVSYIINEQVMESTYTYGKEEKVSIIAPKKKE